jgi:putative addiction module component (TIGR02574 family)
MSPVTDEGIFVAALALNRKERAELAHKLIVSLDEEGEELSEAEWNKVWGEEALRRLRQIEDGTVKEIPGEEVMARVRALLEKTRPTQAPAEPRSPEAKASTGPPPNATTAQRMLWTPTPGQDLTKTLFPLEPAQAKPR